MTNPLRWDEAVPSVEEVENAEPIMLMRRVVGDITEHRLVWQATWLASATDRRSVTLWNERPNVYGVICTSTNHGQTSTWGSEEKCLDLAQWWAGWRALQKEVL